MTEALEDQLRRALRPVDAPQGLADRIVAALPERRTASVTPLSVTSRVAPPARARRRFLMPAALAASLVCAVFLGQKVAQQRAIIDRAHEAQRIAEQRGLEAKAELMQALRITSQKLDLAYEAMDKPRSPDAQENPT